MSFASGEVLGSISPDAFLATRKTMRLRAVLLMLLPLACAVPARAQLSTLETDQLRLVYFSPGQSYLAPHVARCFENSMGFHRRLLNYTPSEKVTVLLTDFGDVGNASATPVPRNGLTIGLAPLSFAYETITANERMNYLLNHE